jgi:hypothetical protein
MLGVAAARLVKRGRSMQNNQLTEVSLDEAAAIEGGLLDLLIGYAIDQAILHMMTCDGPNPNPLIIYQATASPAS